MENLDKLVQLITDRLLENLQQSPDLNRTSVYVIGKSATTELLRNHGYQVLDRHEAADFVVVDCLHLDSFLRVASLAPANEVESNLLTSLLEGKKVLVALETFDIEQYKHSAKSLLYRELMQQKSKLEKYGAQFYTEGNLLALLGHAQKMAEEVSVRPQKQVEAKSRLITEGKLRELGLTEGDVFKIEKDMIVTALAKDYLKRQKIRIEK